MLPSNPNTARILLCASAAHCARVLHAAAQARVHLHGLQPSTAWPTPSDDASTVLWALLPADVADAQALHTEQQWRAQLLQGSAPFAVHMLYGSAAQQAQQLAPWIRSSAAALSASDDCWECLDAASEQKLFQHLLARP